MLKIVLVFACLFVAFFVFQGFIEVANAPDLFESHENQSGSIAEEAEDD